MPTQNITPSNSNFVAGLSPAGWFVPLDNSYAETPNNGNYAKWTFTGTSFAINVDVSMLVNASVSAGDYPIIRYSVDNGIYTDYQLQSTDIQISIAIGLISRTHTVIIWLRAQQWDLIDLWNLPVSVLRITSVAIDSGASLGTSLAPKRAFFFGDSITFGNYVLFEQDPEGDDGVENWVGITGISLNLEFGRAGLPAQGWITPGGGNVPQFIDSWNFIFSGQPRNFSNLDYIFVNEGTNDFGLDSSVITTWLGNMRTACGPNTYIFMIIPFGQFNASVITTGVTNYRIANPFDTNIFLINPGLLYAAGLARTGSATYVSGDGLHPNVYGSELLGAATTSAVQNALIISFQISNIIALGFLLPRLTTSQKNLIVSPSEGLMVFDTTLNKYCVFTGSVWETISLL